MRPWLAGSLVFGSSAAVLILEILATRLLAPYMGLTQQTVTAVIGIVLAGIALGTWLGGKAADRIEPRLLIGPELFAGGVTALVSYPLVRVLGPGLAESAPGAVVLLAAIATFLPAALLSAVTPAVIKAVLADLDHTGRVVGRLSALGTAGAILGSFLAGFVLVAAFPTSTTILAVGAVLCVAGAGVWWWAGRSVSVALALLPLGLMGAAVTVAVPDPCDTETTYSCARVVETSETGRLLLLDTVRNSHVDLEDPTELRFTYTRTFAAVIDAHTAGPIEVLHIGGGGFTMPRWVAATRPGSRNVVVELDAEVVEIARRQLGLEPSPTREVIVEDARVALPRLAAGRFDVVLGDAFSGLVVPWHLTTVEFAEEIRRVLSPGGVYAVNVIDHDDLAFLRAEVATLEQVFPHVVVATLPQRYRTGGNFVIVASDAPLSPERVARLGAQLDLDLEVRTGEALADLVDNAEPLTDDHAPVDQLLG